MIAVINFCHCWVRENLEIRWASNLQLSFPGGSLRHQSSFCSTTSIVGNLLTFSVWFAVSNHLYNELKKIMKVCGFIFITVLNITIVLLSSKVLFDDRKIRRQTRNFYWRGLWKGKRAGWILTFLKNSSNEQTTLCAKREQKSLPFMLRFVSIPLPVISVEVSSFLKILGKLTKQISAADWHDRARNRTPSWTLARTVATRRLELRGGVARLHTTVVCRRILEKNWRWYCHFRCALWPRISHALWIYCFQHWSKKYNTSH